MNFITEVYWEMGCRSKNQDSLSLQQVGTSCGRVFFALVSDGIGGLCEGENASGFISEHMTKVFYHQLTDLIRRRRGKKAIESCLRRNCHELCLKMSRYAEGKNMEMGATMSLLLVWKNRYNICHIGDSRIYRFRKGSIRQLTRDHTDPAGVLRKCLGSFPFQKPDVIAGKVRKNTGFLLCSDGFYRRMTEKEYALLNPGELSREEQIQKRLREIGISVQERGEKDNLSAVYVKVI